MRRWVEYFGFALFGLVAFALVWTVPYAIVTGYRSGISGSKRWELLRRATKESPRADFGHFPPVSFDQGFPLVYKHFYTYVTDARYRGRVLENGGIAAAIVVALGGGLAILLFATRRPTTHGDARFGTLHEARGAGLAAKTGLIVGRLGGQTLVSDDPGHVLVVGPTRSGKGVSFVIPNGLTWPGSMVVLDIKSENIELFGKARKARGDDIFVFAPGTAKTHRYNPLDYVRRGPEMATDCGNIAGFLVTSNVENEWTLAARKVVAALLGYVMTSEQFEGARYIRSAVRVISTGEDMANVLGAIVEAESRSGVVPRWVLDDFNQFIAIPDRTRGSVMFNVSNAFAPWSSPLICSATETSDFDLRELRRRRMSIFIGSPLADLESYRPLVRILFQQVHDVLMRQLPSDDEPHRVLLLLDEFFALGRMSSLASKIAVSAGYGFRMAIVLQNLSQLDEIYGKPTRETLVSGCALKLFVAINDNQTAEYVSDALGTYTAITTTKIAGAGFSQSRVSIGQMAAPLRRAAELTRMRKDKSILLVANARPFEMNKLYYYRSGRLKRMKAESERAQILVPALREWVDPKLWMDAVARASGGGAITAEQGRKDETTDTKAIESAALPVALASSIGEAAAIAARPEVEAIIDARIQEDFARAVAEIDIAISERTGADREELVRARDELVAAHEELARAWA